MYGHGKSQKARDIGPHLFVTSEEVVYPGQGTLLSWDAVISISDSDMLGRLSDGMDVS